MRTYLCLLISLFFLIVFTSTIHAVTVYVPDDFDTIQAGIDACTDGDTVIVRDGTYTGDGNRDIDFTGKAIVLMSENGPEVTIINCPGSPREFRGFYFHSGEGASSIVHGFTITNGWAAYGGGTCNEESSPTITNCIFTGNSAYNLGGGMCNTNSSPTVTNCIFVGNSTGSGGGGMYNNSSSPTVTNCVFSGNQTWPGATADGGGMCNYYSSPMVSNCTFTENSAELGEGGGMKNSNFSDPTVSNCKFIGNMAMEGGGMSNEYSSPMITNCTFTENSSAYGGGGGMRNGYFSDPTVSNCTFSRNTAAYRGGGICNELSNPIVTNCIFWGDLPDEIANMFGCDPIVTYSNVEGGYPGEGNIEADPFFLRYKGFDYLLDVDSPCIDTGDPSIEDGISDWHPRWPDWYPNGARSDMGAYGGPGNKGWLAYREWGVPVDANWRQYGFDCQNTGYNPYETALSPTTVGELQVDWTRSFGWSVYSNPAMVDGVVYMGTYGDYVYALNAETGETIWSRYTNGTVGGPAVIDGMVYVGSRHSPMVYALDAETGEPIWTSTIGGIVVDTSPTVDDGVVYMGAEDGKLYALDAATGDVLWSGINSDDQIFTASVGNNMVYASSRGDSKLYALDIKTGDTIWTVTLGHKIMSAAVAGSVVFAGAADGNLYALDALTGDMLWSAMTGGNEVYAPAVANGVVYVGADDNALYAFDIDTHELLWSATTRGAIEGIPTVANGVVYVAETPGPWYVYAFDTATGDLLWEYDLGSLSAHTFTSPTVADGKMYVSATFDYTIYAFHLPE